MLCWKFQMTFVNRKRQVHTKIVSSVWCWLDKILPVFCNCHFSSYILEDHIICSNNRKERNNLCPWLFFGIYNSNLSQQYRRRSSKSVQHYNSQQKMAGEKKLIFQHYAFLHSFIAFCVFCFLYAMRFFFSISNFIKTLPNAIFGERKKVIWSRLLWRLFQLTNNFYHYHSKDGKSKIIKAKKLLTSRKSFAN